MALKHGQVLPPGEPPRPVWHVQLALPGGGIVPLLRLLLLLQHCRDVWFL